MWNCSPSSISMRHWILTVCKALSTKYCILSILEGYQSIIKAFVYHFSSKENSFTLIMWAWQYSCDEEIQMLFFPLHNKTTWGLLKLNNLLNHLQGWQLDPHLYTQIFIHSKVFFEGLYIPSTVPITGAMIKKALLFWSSYSRWGDGKITNATEEKLVSGWVMQMQIKCTDS